MNATVGGDRFVIPQWLPFSTASQQREASTFGTEGIVPDYSAARVSFNEALLEFYDQPSPFLATELMGIASVIGDTGAAQKLAEVVLSEAVSSAVAKVQAQVLLNQHSPPSESEQTGIKNAKKRVVSHAHDVIAWIESARLYTILGQRKKARRAVLCALHLAPSDRFIVRAAVRFFVHHDDWDIARRVAIKAYEINPDPLIFGPLLSVSTQLGKLPHGLKSIIAHAFKAQSKFLYSEILEAAGTLEILNGAEQRSRRFFREAWKDPSKAVISHSQWILREHLPNLAHSQTIDFTKSQEALSWLRYASLNFAGAMASCTAWALEEPYSKTPHLLGSIAACQAGDFNRAELLAKEGLKANPGNIALLNNLAFSQLRNSKLQAAEKSLILLRPRLAREDEVAPAATYGLWCMAKGKFDEGESWYGKAFGRALDIKNKPLALCAALNFVLSSIDFAKTIDIQLLYTVQKAVHQIPNPDCIALATTIAGRLKSTSLQGSDETSKAAKGFIESIGMAHTRYLDQMRSRFENAGISADADSFPTEGSPTGTDINTKSDFSHLTHESSDPVSEIRRSFDKPQHRPPLM